MKGVRGTLAHPVITSTLLLVASLIGCGGGGGGGGAGSDQSNDTGDRSFVLEEVYFGRPILDPDGSVVQVINPESIIETDPITGIIIEGFPKTLFTGASLTELGSFNLSDPPSSEYQVRILPRNGAVLLDFSLPVDPGCLNLDPDHLLTNQSPLRVVTDRGDPVPVQVTVDGSAVILNPVAAGNVGFPPSPLTFDQDGNPITSPNGFLRIFVNSAGTGLNVVASTDSKVLSARDDLFGTPVKPIGFNPGNSRLDFIAFGDVSFNGFLPDLSPPRIIREVRYEGTVGDGSNLLTIVDPDLDPLYDPDHPELSFNDLANGGAGEWAAGLLTLRPGTAQEEKRKVISNTPNTLTVAEAFATPPNPGIPGVEDPDEYILQRAEFFEPIPGLSDLSTAVDPENFPKDPLDPQDLKNSSLFNFVFFDAWNEAEGTWDPVDYDPGPEGLTPIETTWRISLRFSEPMDVSSFRPYETFYVCDGALEVDDPAFNSMKLGRVTGRDQNRIISFEPVLTDQFGITGDQLFGFGGNPKNLRLVIRVVPSQSVLDSFYLSFEEDLPDWVETDLDRRGVFGVISLGGRPLGLPEQFFDRGSPGHCVAFSSSPGYGPFPPAVDLKYAFNVSQNDEIPETGAFVHRFMGRPETGVGGVFQISGVIFNDHLPVDPEDPIEVGLVLYGPRIADIGIGVNGFLSGHPVEFIEHVLDEQNSPPPSSPTYPDPFFAIPFGVGTPINTSFGCRFQHIFRRGECSPDVLSFEGSDLDLIGLAWSPIGGWVTNTVIEKMSIAISNSNREPNTRQNQGVPIDGESGLLQNFADNYNPYPQRIVAGAGNNGVPYVVDWANLFAPKNAGGKVFLLHQLAQVRQACQRPGFQLRFKEFASRGIPDGSEPERRGWR